MPRNPKPSAPRARHSRAQVIAARERKFATRFQRLKNEPQRLYYGAVLSDIKEWSWIYSPEPARSFLVAAVGYDAPLIHVHPEVLRRLPRWVRDSLYLASSLRLEQLADRIHYRNHARDPYDYNVPLSVLDGYRTREKRRWRKEAWEEVLVGDPNGERLDPGAAHRRLVDALLNDPATRDLYLIYLERSTASGRGEGEEWQREHGRELEEIEKSFDEGPGDTDAGSADDAGDTDAIDSSKEEQ